MKTILLTFKIYLWYFILVVPVATIGEILQWVDRQDNFWALVSRSFWGSVIYFGFYGLLAIPVFFVIAWALILRQQNSK